MREKKERLCKWCESPLKEPENKNTRPKLYCNDDCKKNKANDTQKKREKELARIKIERLLDNKPITIDPKYLNRGRK